MLGDAYCRSFGRAGKTSQFWLRRAPAGEKVEVSLEGSGMMAKWLWYFAFGLTWLGVTCGPGDQKAIAREGTNAGMAHALEAP